MRQWSVTSTSRSHKRSGLLFPIPQWQSFPLITQDLISHHSPAACYQELTAFTFKQQRLAKREYGVYCLGEGLPAILNLPLSAVRYTGTRWTTNPQLQPLQQRGNPSPPRYPLVLLFLGASSIIYRSFTEFHHSPVAHGYGTPDILRVTAQVSLLINDWALIPLASVNGFEPMMCCHARLTVSCLDRTRLN